MRIKEKSKKIPYNTFRKGIVAGMLGLTLGVSAFGLSGCSFEGVAGIDGKDGLNGTTWHYGEDYSTYDGTINVGDFFIDTNDYILYKKTSDGWDTVMTNFGKKGNDATNIELQVDSGKVQWRYKTGDDTAWKDLIEVSTITGTDGREIELQTGSEYIQWRYTSGEDTAWKNLMLISSLQGKDGATWLSGTTAPTDAQGKDGDFYLNESNFDIYKKADNSWTKVGNIKGSTGNGVKSVEKTKTEGLIDTYTITFTDGTSTTFTITNGENGKNGTVWLTGTEITGTGDNISAEISGAKVGDIYFNTDTCDIYTCEAENVWKWISNIKGDRGPTVEEYALEVLKGAIDNMSCENGYTIDVLYGEKGITDSEIGYGRDVDTYNSEDGSWSDVWMSTGSSYTKDDVLNFTAEYGADVTFTAQDDDGKYYKYNYVGATETTAPNYTKKTEYTKEQYESSGPNTFNNEINGIKSIAYKDNIEAVKEAGIAYAMELYGEAIPQLNPKADVAATKARGQYTMTLTVWDENVDINVDSTTTIPGANVEIVYEITFTEDGIISYSTTTSMSATVNEQEITQTEFEQVAFGEYDEKYDVDFGDIVKKEWFEDSENN